MRLILRPAPAGRPQRRMVLTGMMGAVAAAVNAPALAGFNFFTGKYTASRAELESQLRSRFPQRRAYGALASVLMSEPRLGLDADANRAALTMRLTLSSPFLQGGSVAGWLGISSALRYDPPTLALRLEQPRADRVELEGLGGEDAVRLQRIGAIVAQETLQGQPLHTFRPEELSVGRKTYEIGDITVLADGIQIQLR